MRNLVKGYGDTRERGQAKFDKLTVLLPRSLGRSDSAATLEALIKAALADEHGQALDKAIADMGLTNSDRPNSAYSRDSGSVEPKLARNRVP
jgi:hypothetical protein